MPKAQTALTLTKTTQSGFTASPVVYTEHSFETSGGAQEKSHQPQFLVVNNAGTLQLLDPNDKAKNPIDIATFDKSIIPLSFACSDIDTGLIGTTYTNAPVCYLAGESSSTTLDVNKITDFNPLDRATSTSTNIPLGTNDKVVVDGDTGSLAIMKSGAVNVYTSADSYGNSKTYQFAKRRKSHWHL